MYIAKQRGWHGRGGDQRASGLFLLVMDKDKKEVCSIEGCLGAHGHRPLAAIVRSVTMHQTGHFMMGDMEIAGVRVGLSGTYGNDGLSHSYVPEAWPYLVPLPPELVHTFWEAGGGHNSAGREGPAVADWARANLKLLTKPIRWIR